MITDTAEGTVMKKYLEYIQCYINLKKKNISVYSQKEPKINQFDDA